MSLSSYIFLAGKYQPRKSLIDGAKSQRQRLSLLLVSAKQLGVMVLLVFLMETFVNYEGGGTVTFVGWLYLLECDMCISQNAKKELDDFLETCQAQCKVSDYKCSYTMWSWGDNHFTQKICGKA